MRKIIWGSLILLISFDSVGAVDVPQLQPDVFSSNIAWEDIVSTNNEAHYYFVDNVVNDSLGYFATFFEQSSNMAPYLRETYNELTWTLDPTMSGAEIAADFDAKYDYSSEPSGDLNLKVMYSLDNQVAKLEWDNGIQLYETTFDYATISGYDIYNQPILNGVTYIDVYVKQYPTYHIYRIVDGVEEELATIEGYNVSETPYAHCNIYYVDGYGWFDDCVRENYLSTSNPYTIEDTKIQFTDLLAPYALQGKTVEYKVIAQTERKINSVPHDWTPIWFAGSYAYYAGYDTTKTNQIWLDGNADQYVDFVPKEEYDKLFGKYYSWLIPTTTLLLN